MSYGPNNQRLSASVARNREPILAVLERVLPAAGVVLEIASGTGEHAVHFAAHLPEVTWQPSDPDPEMGESVAAWVAAAGLDNIRPPLIIDATAADLPVAAADAVICINMVHIAPWAAAEGLFAGAGRVLAAGGILYMYGPYRVAGAHTAPSNAAFDADLRRRNPAWGVRDLNDITALAVRHGLVLAEIVDMPANNKSVIFRRI
jgi:SAM-dependent methyltransferase